MNRSLTKCTLGQCEELALLAEKTFRESFQAMNDPDDFEDYIQKAFKPEQIRKELWTDDSDFYLLYQDGLLAGYFKTNICQAQTDIRDAEGMELERIYVLSEFQGNGLGRYMIEAAKEQALLLHKTYLWLGVWKENKDAVRFYQDNGFRIFGEHPYYIGNDRQMDWLMRYDLITFPDD
jgi:ribosomal protein S18 acetylase RimI-like enzyme